VHLQMKIIVRGIGWITRDAYGGVRTGTRHAFADGEAADTLSKKNLFSYPVKNVGRFDRMSRMTCYAAALALKDAAVAYSAFQKQDIGVIGTSSAGSLQADVEYFKDYIEGGRTLSRGNLFIYTLPSSPFGEAAIHFGLRGPLLYLQDREASLAAVIDASEEMLLAGETTMVLAGKVEEDESIFVVVQAEPAADAPVLCDLSAIRTTTEADPDIPGIIESYSVLGNKKGAV